MTAPRLTIAFFTNDAGPAEDFLAAQIHTLDRRHFRIVLIARPEQIARFERILPPDVEAAPFRLRKLSRFVESFRLWRVLREYRVDVVHAHPAYRRLLKFPLARLAPPVILEDPEMHDGADSRRYRQVWNERQDALRAHRETMRRLAREAA